MRSLSRSQFRAYFQPSRIVIGLLPYFDTVNPITLCFTMSSSYFPPMYAIAIEQGSLSHELVRNSDRITLAVPGQSLAEETLACGVMSGRDTDKVTELDLRIEQVGARSAAGLIGAIANLDCDITTRTEPGDHITAFCEVKEFLVDDGVTDLPLLSVGPRTEGYKVLARHGLHRIAVVDTP